jgi:uncharacterized protein YceH (UPF0502 family)
MDQLADELVHLRGPFFERVLDRLSEDEAKRFFEIVCPYEVERAERLEGKIDGWARANAELEQEIDNLKEEVDSLKQELRETQHAQA